MKSFEPADGESARWRKLYDLVLSKQPDDEILYREAEEFLGVDRRTALNAMWQARAHLERDGQQSVRTVKDFGWIVMKAGDHIAESDKHLKRSRNQAKYALRKVSAIDERRGELSQFEREAADRAKLRASALLELSSRRKPSFTELQKQAERKKLL